MLSNKPTNMVYSLSCLQVSNNLHQKCVQCARTGSGGRHPTSTRRLVPREMHQAVHPHGQALMPAVGHRQHWCSVDPIDIPVKISSINVSGVFVSGYLPYDQIPKTEPGVIIVCCQAVRCLACTLTYDVVPFSVVCTCFGILNSELLSFGQL